MVDSSEMRMFENGLARGREIGAEQERSRIIQLLLENAEGEYRKVMVTPKLIASINMDKGK